MKKIFFLFFILCFAKEFSFSQTKTPVNFGSKNTIVKAVDAIAADSMQYLPTGSDTPTVAMTLRYQTARKGAMIYHDSVHNKSYIYFPSSSVQAWQELAVGGSGVTSVALAAPSIFTVTGSPVTSIGTLTFASNNTTGDIIYGSASNTLAYLSDVSAGSYLRSGGVTTAPLWSTVKIPNTAVSGDIWIASATNIITALPKATDGQFLKLVSGLPAWASISASDISGISATAPITYSAGVISTSMSTGKLIGRYSGGSGVMQEITISTGLTLDGSGNLTADAVTGDITWSVLDILNTPPGSPADGDVYLVGTAGTGAWSGHNNQIATWDAGGAAWTFSSASSGDLLYDAANSSVYKFNGSTWTLISNSGLAWKVGGNTGVANGKLGTIDNKAMTIMTHNISRIGIASNGNITFTGLTGAATGLMGLSTVGLASNVQIGSGLSLIGGTLSATGSGGTVTTVSATDGNGFDFTVTNPTTTPAISLTTTVTDTRVMYSNATAIAGAAGMTFDGTSALTLGVTNTTLGKLLLKGNTSGTVTVNSAAAAGTWTFTLPTTGGTNNYVLTTNGSGVSTWTDVTTIATGTVTSFSAGNLSPLFTSSVATATTTPALTFSLSNAAAGTVFANVSTSSAAPAYTSSPVLGAQTVATGSLGFSGTTSGVVTMKSADAAGTWTFTLPTTGGTNNYVLSTNGSGTSTWTDPNTLLTGAWLLASGGTLSGTNTITAGTNPIIFSTGVTTGTGATAGIQVAANSLTTGNGFDASSSSITTGNLMKLTSTSTAANAFSLLNINSSGANASSTRTATGQTISVTNTGTTSTNVGLNITASGATNNYALITGGGNVGIGTSTPTALLQVAGGISISAANIINGSVINIPAQTITDNSSSGSTGLAALGIINIAQPTIAASNSTTYTGTVATLQIANAPTNGTNMTLSGATYALNIVAGTTNLQATTTNGLLTAKAGVTLTTAPALTINSPATIVATNNAVTASTTAYAFSGNNTNTQTTGYIRGISYTSANGAASSATANIGTMYGFTSEIRTQANNATALPNAIGFYSDYMLSTTQTQKVTTVKQFYAAPLGSSFIAGTAGDQTIQVVANSGNVYGLMIDSSNAVTFGAAAYNSTTATANFWGVYVRPNSGGTLEYNQLTWTAIGQADGTVPTDALFVKGNLALSTAGNKIKIATGSNASIGTATLSGGTVTVSTTAVTASSIIFLTDATTGALTNVGSPTVGTITAGTSFVINSTNPLDASSVNWIIIN